MTEAEWLACTDPLKLLDCLRGKASDRKTRLFACAACRHVWRLFPEDRSREVVAVSERFADGLATKQAVKIARKHAWGFEYATALLNADEAVEKTIRFIVDELERLADSSGHNPFLTGNEADIQTAMRLTKEVFAEQCDLLRDIIGRPFLSVTAHPAWLTWNDGTVPKLAQAIYGERRFADMPVLADALMDAGCHDEDILSHCRSEGPHVRGCWVVDLLLGKS